MEPQQDEIVFDIDGLEKDANWAQVHGGSLRGFHPETDKGVLNRFAKFLYDNGVPQVQIAGIISNAAAEGGTLGVHSDKGAFGLFGYRGARRRNADLNINVDKMSEQEQFQYALDTIKGKIDRSNNWTQDFDNFWNAQTPGEAAYYLSTGYVRPDPYDTKQKKYINRNRSEARRRQSDVLNNYLHFKPRQIKATPIEYENSFPRVDVSFAKNLNLNNLPQINIPTAKKGRILYKYQPIT